MRPNRFLLAFVVPVALATAEKCAQLKTFNLPR
jgi:hypothetical protein